MNTPVTIVEAVEVKSTSIAIRPYFDPQIENMGLEKYGLSLYDGVFHEEPLACLEINGIKRYVTGLNEFAPEVKSIQNEEERKAKIKEIRTVVAQLEKELGANVVDPKDPDFWNKVKVCRPDNSGLWDKIKLRCGNSPVFLDPAKDPYDLIKLYAIEAGGFSIVAKSYQDAKRSMVPPKFYLDKQEETIAIKTEAKKLKNAALAELQNLYNTNVNKLMYICKVLDASSAQYRKSTPTDVMYDNMDKFINGELHEKNIRKASEQFLAAAQLDMETLKLRALIKDGTFYKQIATKSDGFIYHMDSNSMMGRNPSECVEYLKNPLNDEILGSLTKKIEKYWTK